MSARVLLAGWLCLCKYGIFRIDSFIALPFFVGMFIPRFCFYVLWVNVFVFCRTTTNAQCPEGMLTSTVNLVKNGDFALGNTGFNSDYGYLLDVNCGNHWLPEGMYSVLPSPRLAHCNFADFGDHTNDKSAMLVVNGATITNQVVWRQTVAVMPNTTYYFSTWIANAINDAPSRMEFSINGKLLGDPIIAPPVAGQWKQFFTVWFSGNSSNADISILNRSTISQGNDFILDDIVFYTCEKPDFSAQLKNAAAGSIIELRNVFFETGSDAILPASDEQLGQLITFLNKNTGLYIALYGHTDYIGNDSDNLLLSEKRARAVYNFLIDKGIAKSRLSYKGFGKQKPIATNETIEGRQKNRRVEFVILNKQQP